MANWSIGLYKDSDGNCPVLNWIKRDGDPQARRKITDKLRMLAQLQRPEDASRPLVDTLRGAVKELRVDKQIRVLFSWERDERTILALNATRKREGDVDESVVDAAVRYRQDWLRRMGKA